MKFPKGRLEISSLRGQICLWDHCDLDLWLPKSNQFVCESKYTFVPTLTRFSRGVLKITPFVFVWMWIMFLYLCPFMCRVLLLSLPIFYVNDVLQFQIFSVCVIMVERLLWPNYLVDTSKLLATSWIVFYNYLYNPPKIFSSWFPIL